MRPADLIEQYEALMLKAQKIVSWYGEPSRLAQNDKGEAWVVYPTCGMSYGDCSLESDTTSTFPANLLAASDEDIEAWKKERDRIAQIKQQAWYAAKQAEREEQERATFEMLKAKYGSQ